MAENQSLQQWHVSEPYLETHCSLGEGPFYEPATNTLRFVDIIKQQLHTVSLTEGPSSLKTLQFNEAVTVTADIEGRDPQKTLLIGAKQGLAVLDRKTGKYEYVTEFGDEKADRIRSNDGVVDPNGRFWLGTMTDFGKGAFQPEGESFSAPFFLSFLLRFSFLCYFSFLFLHQLLGCTIMPARGHFLSTWQAARPPR